MSSEKIVIGVAVHRGSAYLSFFHLDFINHKVWKNWRGENDSIIDYDVDK